MQKKPLVLIICGAVVILSIVLLIIYLAKGGSTDIRDIAGGRESQNAETPILNLSAYPLEETEDSVEISIDASIGGNNEIISVTTPDGKTLGYNSTKKFSVSDNGEYTFTVKASNGAETTKKITISNIIKISADNPYIPEGFSHIDGTSVETGFVIEDKSGNQFVWVPVETGKPTRTVPSEKYKEDDDTASALNNSIAKYYGFYIAKYEASKDNVKGIVVANSKENTIPWINVSYEDAYNASKNTATSYDYVGVKTALINSYAWDTALDWLNNSVTNYSSSKNYGNYSNQILPTGSTENDIVNEIADMSGNVREWTTEKYEEKDENSEVDISSNTSSIDENSRNSNANEVSNLDEISYRVIRGGSATMEKTASSRIGERTDLIDKYWGFRMILYKE